MSRRSLIRRIIVIAIIIYVCFILQNTVFTTFSIAGISPNLLIVVTSTVGFMRGRNEGMIVGFFCGLLMDLFFGEVIGFYALLYVFIGFLNGFMTVIFFKDDIKLPLLFIGVSDFAVSILTYFFMFLFRNRTDFGFYLGHIIVPELIYTILVALVLYFVLLKINDRLEKLEKKSETKFV